MNSIIIVSSVTTKPMTRGCSKFNKEEKKKKSTPPQLIISSVVHYRFNRFLDVVAAVVTGIEVIILVRNVFFLHLTLAFSVVFMS